MQFRKMLVRVASVGFIFFISAYSFWPVALIFGSYDRVLYSLYWADPKNIGLTFYYSTALMLLILSIYIFIITSIMIILSLIFRFILIFSILINRVNASTYALVIPYRAEIVISFVTAAIFLLLKFDPGGYWFWFFD